MSFTTAAFIRKNTPELRQKLEELGYKLRGSWDLKTDGIIQLLTPHSDEYITFPNEDYEKLVKIYPRQIACGENEILFLAIAALRDDSDMNQLFTDGKEWFLCERGCFEGYSEFCNTYPEFWGHSYRKATPAELVEHFKEK